MTQTTTIQMRRGTAAQWTSANTLLAAGEWGLESDTQKLKIGDGSTSWNSLSYIVGGAGSLGGVSVDGSAAAGLSLNATSSSVATWSAAQPQTPLPTDYGYKAWAFDPATLGGNLAPTSGLLYLTRIDVHVPITISKLMLFCLSPGTMTSGQNFLGLYDSSGALVHSSSDQSSNYNVQQDVVAAISSTNLTPGNFYWVGVLVNASSPPSIARVSNTTSQAGQGQITASVARFGTYGTSLTSLPSSITPSLITKSTYAVWTAVS